VRRGFYNFIIRIDFYLIDFIIKYVYIYIYIYVYIKQIQILCDATIRFILPEFCVSNRSFESVSKISVRYVV